MGLHLPGAAFVNPNTPLRDALTAARPRSASPRSRRSATTTRRSARCVDERAFVNGVVGLLATGGSTNHTIHLVAMARAAGIQLDLGRLRRPLRRRAAAGAASIPNGIADVNHFHAAGGMGFVIGELLDAGLLHADVRTVAGDGGLARYRERAGPRRRQLVWRPRRRREPATRRSLRAGRRSRSAPTAGSSCSTAISAAP